MKKRYLRPSIQWVLTIVFIFQFMFMGVNDFTPSLKAITLMALNIITMLINGHILLKYGKGIFED